MAPRQRVVGARYRRLALVASALVVTCMPLAQMALVHDDGASADVVVVLGARTYADGTPSQALADRVASGADLVLHGRAPWLLVSGGPGDGPVHETTAMKNLATHLGVRGEAIDVDTTGTDTRATAIATAAWLARTGRRRVLVVSHRYHLPRVLLEMRRAGVDARGVPAEESRLLVKMPWSVTREVAAWWVTVVRAAV